MKAVIVTGCPRSGTRRLQACFGQAKVPAAHESDDLITISCHLAIDVDQYLVPHEPYWNRRIDEIWHQVRDPMRCIPSMAANIGSRFWSWQYQYTGLHPSSFRCRMEFASHFWVRWNKEAEDRGPIYRFKIEDLDLEWVEMWSRLGIGQAPEIDERSKKYRGLDVPATNKKVDPLTPMELLEYGPTIHDSVMMMAEQYGYSYG